MLTLKQKTKMENLDIYILTSIVATLFIVFFIGIYRAVKDVDENSYKYEKPGGPRVYLFNLMAKLFEDEKMTKKEKSSYIIDELEKLYPTTPVPLDHSDPYTLLIAVLLSAQCTDKRVNAVTPALFTKYPSAKEMAGARISDIEKIIK